MIIVRVIKPGEWEVVTEVKAIFGPAETIAKRLQLKQIDARRVGKEVHVYVS